MFNIAKVRADFPILNSAMRCRPLVYFDNAATSLTPECVLQEEERYYRAMRANINRSVHELSEKATIAYEHTRDLVTTFLNAQSREEIIFVKSATEGANLVAHSYARQFLKEGDEIAVSELEHHANLIPWQEAAKAVGATLTFLPVDAEAGMIRLEDVDAVLTEKTKLVAFTAMSNVTGTIQPAKELIAKARAKGAVVFLDAAQYACHANIDVQDLDCDFLTFSAHKMLGPTGVGILYGKNALLEKMPPFLFGGDMILQVWKDRAVYRDLPEKFEAGTPNIAGCIAFAKAIEYLTAIDLEAVLRHEQEMVAYAMREAEKIGDVIIYGDKDPAKRGGIFSFNIEGVHPHDVGGILDGEGIAIRSGHHCCQPLMRLWNVPGTARASFYFYNTMDEVERFVKTLPRVKETLSGNR